MLKDFLEGKPLRHPLHPMLVHFPIGLFLLSLLLDLASLASIPNLVRDSFYAMLLGVITALVVALYGINLGVRSSLLLDPKIRPVPLILSLIGIALLSVSGYLGGRLVYDEGIGVGRHKRRTATPESTLYLSTANQIGTQNQQGDVVFVPVPAAEHLGDKETLRAEIDGQIMTIVKIDNQFYAFQEFCTHRFGPL